MKGLQSTPCFGPIAGCQASPPQSTLILGGFRLFLLEKSFLGSSVEDFLYLKPCSGGGGKGTHSRGNRDSALMPARERSPPGALAFPCKRAVGAGRLPWPSLARIRTPRSARLLRSCRCPRGRDKHRGQRALPSPGREARLVAPAAAAAGPREPRSPRSELRFIHFSFLLLLNSGP